MPRQISLKTILILVFCISFCLAIFAQGGPRVVTILVAVLMANFAGAVVALAVTFLFRFPRDGTLRTEQLDTRAARNCDRENDTG